MSNTLDLRAIPRTEDGRIAVGERANLSTSLNLFGDNTSHDPVLAPKHPREKIWEFAALSGRAVSRAEISKAMGCVKAPWINVHIETLVSEGWLIKTHTYRPNGAVMYWYQAAQR